jgi:hypothetical protein
MILDLVGFLQTIGCWCSVWVRSRGGGGEVVVA